MRREPRCFGLARTRWRLADLRTVMPELAGYSLAGLSRLLRRGGIRLKRGRLRLHSPDPAYDAKLRRIARARRLAQRAPHRVRLLYADECSLHRQPSLGPVWWPVPDEPTTPLSTGKDRTARYAGALDTQTGQVTWITRTKMTVPSICAFLTRIRQTYPGMHLVVAWDNWLVHRHPRVLQAAQDLRIHVLWLPTYAPWTNPIEKLWRWLRQTIVHAHRLAEQWDRLRDQVAAFLDQFASGSPDLLHYAGLLPN